MSPAPDRYDHPVPARCDTCCFSGSDGAFGELETCGADLGCSPEDEETVVCAVDKWFAAKKVGPCPAWKSSQWNDPREIDWLIAHCTARGLLGEPNQTPSPPEGVSETPG